MGVAWDIYTGSREISRFSAHILKQPPSGVYVLPSSASPFSKNAILWTYLTWSSIQSWWSLCVQIASMVRAALRSIRTLRERSFQIHRFHSDQLSWRWLSCRWNDWHVVLYCDLNSLYFVCVQRVDFQSGVFHPQVDYYTGELETKKEYQRWRYVFYFLFVVITSLLVSVFDEGETWIVSVTCLVMLGATF